MAKKRKKKKKQRKHNRVSPLLIFLLLAALILLYVDYQGEQRVYAYLPEEVKEQIEVLDDFVSPSAYKPTSTYEGLHLSAPLYDREEQIFHHSGYSVSYNEMWRLPNWAGYELTREKTKGTVPRATHFNPNPRVIGVSATNQDYANSGYDRGHLVPAADMKWSKQAMEESFYFTNICPQLHNLNAGDWKELEEKVREWAVKDSAIVVVSGPIVSKKPKRIGVNKVAVPKAFFKVILSPYAHPPQAIGFIMNNEKCNKPLRKYAVTVDSVEVVTGIDFFPTLPNEVEEKVESKYKLDYWRL